jgi:diguanylate cyclase (GGDEF)-like protein
MSGPTHHVIVIDPDDQRRPALVELLRRLGHEATGYAEPLAGAHAALAGPPAAVVADLWMRGISGAQLARLLGAEPATEGVPVVLRGPDSRRDRFWAERAGAAAYVTKDNDDALQGALAPLLATAPDDDAFFLQLEDAESVLRDRIAACLDAALFESVVAAEVRALSTCAGFDRLFEALTRFLSRVVRYRWFALWLREPHHFGVHHARGHGDSEREARAALDVAAGLPVVRLEDGEPCLGPVRGAPLVRNIELGSERIARMAISLVDDADTQPVVLADLVAREIGGPLRLAALVESIERAATTDPLTGLPNRRAFLQALEMERLRTERHGYPLSVLMVDVDHFKAINDEHGHAAGDEMLTALARVLVGQLRQVDVISRWGGEEFVIALADADPAGAGVAAERLRQAAARLTVAGPDGQALHTTVSIGATTRQSGDDPRKLIDRADQAMYQAKAAGRNRVVVAVVAPAPPKSTVAALKAEPKSDENQGDTHDG